MLIECPVLFDANLAKQDWEIETCVPQKNSSWIVNFLDRIGKEVIDSFDPHTPLPIQEVSSRFTILGNGFVDLGLGGINGIATNLSDAKAHAEYLSKLANGHSVDWIHNCSHGSLIDLIEVFTMNFLGASPNTAKLLQESWGEFHLKNMENADAKYLQFCHSQGAIHVRNALKDLPKEIRDRIIVIAIAPAVIISKDLCYDAYNYASKRDVVNYGELCYASGFDMSECGVSKTVEMLMNLRKELILLDPHPEATGMDHDFQSPTFIKTIIKHLKEHINRNGMYK